MLSKSNPKNRGLSLKVCCKEIKNVKKKKILKKINKLHDICKNEVDTLSKQNVIHTPMPCFFVARQCEKMSRPLTTVPSKDPVKKVAVKYLKYADIYNPSPCTTWCLA